MFDSLICCDLHVYLMVDVYDIWWRHQMGTFSALLAICAGNSPVTGEFPAQRPVTRSFDVFFDLRLNKGWVNSCKAGDLRRHCAYHDVIVMHTFILMWDVLWKMRKHYCPFETRIYFVSNVFMPTGRICTKCVLVFFSLWFMSLAGLLKVKPVPDECIDSLTL